MFKYCRSESFVYLELVSIQRTGVCRKILEKTVKKGSQPFSPALSDSKWHWTVLRTHNILNKRVNWHSSVNYSIWLGNATGVDTMVANWTKTFKTNSQVQLQTNSAWVTVS